jgi:hypothetical protein
MARVLEREARSGDVNTLTPADKPLRIGMFALIAELC